jgi:cyclopropane fatty-acyl-phospholipid synthase-like methyltransferase
MFRKMFFNLSYFQAPPWDSGISPPELMDFINHNPPGRALDLGCGSGTNVITLAQHGWQVTGIDFARRAIHLAQAKAKQAGVNVSLSVGDVTRLDTVQGPFDLILDIGCFHSIQGKGKIRYLGHVNRLLAPEGTYLMYGFLKEPGTSAPGLISEDIFNLTSTMQLVYRQDGRERGQRPSTWFTFKKYNSR